MNKEQIKEIARVLEESYGKCVNFSDCTNRKCSQCYAEALYNVGYRKVTDGAVILTPEERDEEMKELARLNRVETELQELNIKYYNEAKDLSREVAELKAKNERLKEVIADQNELCWNCKKSVKEFAEKLEKKSFDKNPFSFKDLVDSTNVVLVTDIDELLKEYEEWKF